MSRPGLSDEGVGGVRAGFAVRRIHTAVKAIVARVLSLGRLNLGVGATTSVPDYLLCLGCAWLLACSAQGRGRTPCGGWGGLIQGGGGGRGEGGSNLPTHPKLTHPPRPPPALQQASMVHCRALKTLSLELL